MSIEEAVKSLKEGKPVLVHDSDKRENEVDIFVRASSITPELVRLMRKDGGGLLCVAIHPEIADAIGLPFMEDLLRDSGIPLLREMVPDRLPYDKRSSFSITVNHKKTRTGITDNDRALTVGYLGEICGKFWDDHNFDIKSDFVRNFRAPGHVHLLRGASKLLSEREGHTELALALALLAGIEPCVALIEMLGDDGKALPVEEAKRYAKEKGLVIIEGSEIKRAFFERYG